MLRTTMTAVAWAAIAAAPAVVSAQATTPPPAVPGTCDCPQGEGRGDLRNLAAFAPLGLLGALAAAGGTPALFAGAGGKEAQNPSVTVATNAPSTSTPGSGALPSDGTTARTDAARNPSGDPAAAGAAPSVSRTGILPDAVSADSLRAGLRAPNTATPLPSVFLLGTGLIAIGCVTVFRTRS